MDNNRNLFNKYKKRLIAAILVLIVLAYIAYTIVSLELYPKYHHLTVMNCCDHPITGLLIIKDKETNVGYPFSVEKKNLGQIGKRKRTVAGLFSEKDIEKDFILVYMPYNGELDEIKEIKLSGIDLKKNNWVLAVGNCRE